MGNCRTIIQIKPFNYYLGELYEGAALQVKDVHAAFVAQFVAETREEITYYTYFCAAGQGISIPNLVGHDSRLGVKPDNYVVIQSGGKMWCGYENFVEHIRQLAPYVEDALFYVMDEEDYLDEFAIVAGELRYQRISEGYPHSDYDLKEILKLKGML